MTWSAFLNPVETNALHIKFFPDQLVQIDPARDHVSPWQRRRTTLNLERAAKFIEDFRGQECNLALVIVLEIKVAIAPNPAPGHALDRLNFDRRELIRLASVMIDKIVPRRNVKMTDFHRRHDTIPIGMKQSAIHSEKIIRRKNDGELEYQPDDLTIEEPLEIRIRGKVLATTMRTPGHDEELTAGFLASEAIVRSYTDIRRISMADENVVDVEPAPGIKVKLNSVQRFGTISSSCGLCGKIGIHAIRQSFPAIGSTGIRISIATLLSLPAKLRRNQGEFARTGGIHAAGIFDVDGKLLLVREDVGRHNAVDKAIGRAFLDGLHPLDRHVLLVSGRVSFEIVQKALAAGIPIIAAISAPSSLAVTFAREANQTLVAFLRSPSFNIYTHTERINLPRA